MLYPDFNDLISYRNHKADKMQLARRKVMTSAHGDHQSPFRGQGLDFDAVREYVPGDDIRNIDWRVTARTGSPHLKLFKEEKERHTILCVDMNSAMRFGTRNTFKSVQAARTASLLGWRALDHQDRLSCCFFGDVQGGLHYIASKKSRQEFYSMLKVLAEPPKEHHQVSITTALDHIYRSARPGSLIYVISDFIDLSLKRVHQAYDFVFISINDPADQALAAAGVIGFCGQEKVLINTDSVKGRQAYADQWEENRRELNALTNRYKIPLLSLSTESDLLVALRRNKWLN